MLSNKFWFSNLIFVTFIWGTTFVLVKDATLDIPVTWFLFYRFFLAFCLTAFLVFLYLLTFNRHLITITNLTSIFKSRGLILGIFLYLSYFFQTFGLQETSPANAAFITGLSIVLVPIFLTFTGEKLKLYPTVFAVVLATTGLGLLTVNFSNLSINKGDIIVLGTAISIAIQILLTDRYVKLEPVLTLTISQFLSMAVLGLMGAFTLESESFVIVEHFTSVVWVALLVTVLFATIYAFAIQTFAQQAKLNPSSIAIIFALEPVFALLYSLYVGQDELNVTKGIGMILILVSTILVAYKQENIDQDNVIHIAEL